MLNPPLEPDDPAPTFNQQREDVSHDAARGRLADDEANRALDKIDIAEREWRQARAAAVRDADPLQLHDD